jgi:hypothetical protein
MNNEPVAWINRKGKDGEHGYLEWDKDDEAKINTPLYTHPAEHDLGIAEAIGFKKGHEAGRQLGMQQERALWELSASTQEIENTYPAKTLTDEEITAISRELFKDYRNYHHYQIEFARKILKKASEK